MAKTQDKEIVYGVEEKEVIEVKRTGRFLFFFRTEWWEEIENQFKLADFLQKALISQQNTKTPYLFGKKEGEHIMEKLKKSDKVWSVLSKKEQGKILKEAGEKSNRLQLEKDNKK